MFGTGLVWGSLAVHNVAARSMPANNMTTASAGLRNALKRDLWCVKLGCIRTISQRLRDQNRSINAKQLDLGIADTLVSVHAGRLDSAYRQQCRQVTGLVDRELACWAARPLRVHTRASSPTDTSNPKIQLPGSVRSEAHRLRHLVLRFDALQLRLQEHRLGIQFVSGSCVEL